MKHIEHRIEIKLSIQEINKKNWNELRKGVDNPFYEWEWLSNLELSKSVARETGWQPLYFVAYEHEEICGIAPLLSLIHI